MKKLILICTAVFLFTACEKDPTDETKDTEAPVIVLTGGDLELPLGVVYTEPGAVGQDETDGLILNVTSTNNIDHTKIGSYQVNYTVTDKAGNEGTAKRVVKYNAQLLAGYYSINDGSGNIETKANYTNSIYNQLTFTKLFSGWHYEPFQNVAVSINQNSFTFVQEYSFTYQHPFDGNITVTLLQEDGQIFYEEGFSGMWQLKQMIYKMKEYRENTGEESIKTFTVNFS